MKRSSSDPSPSDSTLSSPSSTMLDAINAEAQLGEPAPKKVKIEKKKPIVFKSAEETVDTSIIIFKQEFQVSSTTLKVHAAYFKRFMDPAHGVNNKVISSRFKYQWFTKVEDDGHWVISSDQKVLMGAMSKLCDLGLF